MSDQEQVKFAEWCVVEVMGRLKVTEQALFGTAMCRVDVYPGDATEPVLTRMFSGSSLYGITIVDETTARAVAAAYVASAEPVARWELPALQAAQKAKATSLDGDEDDDDPERYEPRYAPRGYAREHPLVDADDDQPAFS